LTFEPPKEFFKSDLWCVVVIMCAKNKRKEKRQKVQKQKQKLKSKSMQGATIINLFCELFMLILWRFSRFYCHYPTTWFHAFDAKIVSIVQVNLLLVKTRSTKFLL